MAWHFKSPPNMARTWKGRSKAGSEMMTSTLPDHLSHKKRHGLATLAVGAVAGLLLDYLSSRNKARTSDAIAIFTRNFDAMVLSES